MSNKTITIIWNDGSPKFSPPPGVTRLKQGDKVTIQLTGAPGDASIDEVTIYANRSNSGKNEKNPSQKECVGKRSGGGKPCTIYDIQFPSSNQAVIIDLENPSVDKHYWFGVGGSPDGWELDPELINEPSPGA